MENNRTIIAIVLIVLLWSGYSLLFPPRPSTLPTETSVEKVQTPREDPQSEPQSSSAKQQRVSAFQEKAQLPTDYVEQSLKVSTPLYDIYLSSVGAAVKKVVLKKYLEENTPESAPYVLFDLEPINRATLLTGGSEGLALSADLPYQLVGPSIRELEVSSENNEISYRGRTLSGLGIIKVYRFYADSYRVDISVQLTNDSGQEQKGSLNLLLLSPWDESMAAGDSYTHVGPISYNGEDIIKGDPEDLVKSPQIFAKGTVWSGFDTKYFAQLVRPRESAGRVQIDMLDGLVRNTFISPFATIAAGQSLSFNYSTYLGPKDVDQLARAENQFEEARDYGFFRILAEPLMHTLKYFNGFLNNYGFAIVLLTICIKLIFWPLTQKSYKSMKGMQKLQPEMQKLREKFSDDKQRLNQEMMTFYKENKVNPLGGCLPMIIQIPVFFALYQVLLGAIELRHAPFIFWLTDLSIKDPYYITPVVMGATMFIQQKMTPTNMDPMQAKIMLAMPIVFTFLFLNFPSGLVVYWLVNNLLTILQQYLIKRQAD